MDLPGWDYDESSGLATCQACGNSWWIAPSDPPPIRHHCTSTARTRSRRGTGLGDLVAGLLKAVGITPLRVGRLLELVRRTKSRVDCGCGKRREQLNRLGRRIVKWWRGSS